MRKSLLFFAAVSLLLASCQKEQLVEEKLSNGVVTEVSATFEALVPDGATKASVSISENTGTFSWQEDDAAAFVLDSKTAYGKGTYNATSQMFQIQGAANSHHDAVYPYDLVGSTSPSTEHVTSVTVPSTREWAANQTNVAMYGTYTSDKYTFKHLGGLVKVTVVNVPTTAKTFVFKTADKKINGTFTVETDNESNEVIKTGTPETGEDTYTLNLPSTITANSTMDFYVPLPVGTGYKFAFYLKDNSSSDLVKIEGTTEQTVTRRSILVMPTITLAAASIEDIYKSATVQEVPAGHSGDFLLAKSESVILKLMSSTDDKDITLKYNGVELPKNLKIVVEGDNYFDAKISGNLPKTHVDFTEGEIKEAAFTTNNSTFSIVYPAKISGTLTVKGGNVLLQGATVNMIEVAKDAVADASSNAPVEINMVKYAEQTPKVTGSVVTEANVKVAPVEGETVTVVKVGNVNVEDTGEGTVEQKDNEVSVSTFDAFKSAIETVVAGQTIKVTANISDASGISVAEGKNFTVDFGGHQYAMECPGAGSAGTKTIGFQLLENSNIVFKNGTIKCTDANKEKTWNSGDDSKGIAMMIQNYANLTLDGITIDATNIAHNGVAVRYALSNNSGNVEYKGATSITTAAGDYAFDVCKYGSYDAPTVTWNSSGTVTGGIELTGGEFVVAKPLALTQPIRTKDAAAKLTVKADITPATGWTSANASDGLVIVKRKADLTIDGTAKISYNSNEQVYCAVKMTEKDDASDTENRAKLTVKGTVTLEGYNAGISGNGNTGRGNTDVTIEGGTIKGCKTNGDECCGIYQPQVGTLTIKGGTIEGLVGVYVKSGSVTTAVSGGTIKGTGAKGTYSPQGNGFINTGDAIVFDNCDYPGGEPNATINGGTFISANGNAVASYAKEGKTPITGFIHGGTFSDLSGLKYVAENGTYKLANNVNLGENILEINSGKTFSIDLNGKTLTGRTNIKHGNVTFKNGNIAGGNKQALNVYGSSESTATNYSVVTIASGVTVTADVYAVCVFGATAGGTGYGAVANIAGTINTNGDTKNGAIFVSGNLGVNNDSEWAVSSKNAVNIQNGAKITSSTDAALALNGSATVTVASGAELTGATAIAAKRGKLIVNGGKITGNGTCVGNPNPYKNGIENTGSAVSAMPTYQNDGPLSVELKGGEYTSNAYTILNNHDGCEFKISGGDFTTTMATDGIAVYARLGSVNITGGEFTNNSNSEATLHVGCPAAVTGNKTPYLTISGSPTVKNNADGPYTWGQQGSAPLTVNMANELTYKAVNISGGTFHGQNPEKDDSWTSESDAHKYFLAEGYEAKESTTGVWTVSAENN